MNNFYLLVGLPGSGKSHMAKQFNGIVVSSDSIREEIYGNEYEQADHARVFDIAHKKIKEGLKKDSVIFDATNLSSKRRMALLNSLPSNTVSYALVMATEFDQVLKQNSMRSRVVPEDAIRRMRENFQIPQKWEGFQDVFLVWGREKSTIFNLNDYNILQDNPNHMLSLSEHLKKTASLLNHDRILHAVGLLHDIGKIDTKRFQNFKGDSTEIAHYYNHHNVSAYEAMFILKQIFGFSEPEVLYAVGLINWHMQPYFLKTEKSIKKFVNKVGDKFWNDLVAINEADKLAKE